VAGRTIIIKATRSGISYNSNQVIPYNCTNLPQGGFAIGERQDRYWLAKMISYANGTLTVEVVNYNVKNIYDLFGKQEAKKPIARLHFQSLDMPQFKAVCTTYVSSVLAQSAVFVVATTDSGSIARLTISVPVRQLSYEFRKKMKWQKEPVLFAISNSNILPEFAYVREYISKQLGYTKITVHIDLETVAGTTTMRSCSSPQIATIDGNFFQVLKFQKVQKESRAILKKFASESLLDINGYLDSQPDSLLHKLGLQGQDIIESILTKEGIRNRQHIDYLANVLHRPDRPLYITLSPNFGFLFVHNTSLYSHFMWEMLNSNATYLWSIPAAVSPADQLAKVTDIISFIRVNGRRAYLHNFDLDSSITFTRIYHSKVNSHVRDHFPYWKYKIEEALI